MATIQEKHVNFNSNMVVNNTGGNLSTDSGLILVKEFMDSISFSTLATHSLTFQDNRNYWLHDNISLLEQLAYDTHFLTVRYITGRNERYWEKHMTVNLN